MAERHFLAGRLAVKIDDDRGRAATRSGRERVLRENRFEPSERIVGASMNSRPIRLTTSRVRSPSTGCRRQPAPGVPCGKLAGRRMRLSRSMYWISSRWSQTWLPVERMSAPVS
jgi:hypothetical protein